MIAALILAVLAIAIAVLVSLCATGRVPRNPIAGIRIPSLFVSDEAWMVGHRAALVPTVVAAVICSVIAAFVVAVPTFAVAGTWTIVVVLLGGLLLASALASRAARTIAAI